MARRRKNCVVSVFAQYGAAYGPQPEMASLCSFFDAGHCLRIGHFSAKKTQQGRAASCGVEGHVRGSL